MLFSLVLNLQVPLAVYPGLVRPGFPCRDFHLSTYRRHPWIPRRYLQVHKDLRASWVWSFDHFHPTYSHHYPLMAPNSQPLSHSWCLRFRRSILYRPRPFLWVFRLMRLPRLLRHPLHRNLFRRRSRRRYYRRLSRLPLCQRFRCYRRVNRYFLLRRWLRKLRRRRFLHKLNPSPSR